MRSSHGRNDVESRERASGGNDGAAHSGEVVAIGMRDLLDQTEQVQSPDLARHRRGGDVQPCDKVGSAPAVNVELTMLQSAQQRLVGGVEEVQPLGRRVRTHARLTQPLQVTLTGAGVLQAGQEREVALVAAQQDLAQVDQAEESTSSAAPARACCADPCVPPCGGA